MPTIMLPGLGMNWFLGNQTGNVSQFDPSGQVSPGQPYIPDEVAKQMVDSLDLRKSMTVSKEAILSYLESLGLSVMLAPEVALSLRTNYGVRPTFSEGSMYSRSGLLIEELMKVVGESYPAPFVDQGPEILTEEEVFHGVITEELQNSEDPTDRAIFREFYDLSPQEIVDIAELYEDLGDEGMGWLEYAYERGGTKLAQEVVEGIYRPHLLRFMSEDVQSLVDAFAPLRSIEKRTRKPVRKSSGSEVVDKIAAEGQLAARLRSGEATGTPVEPSREIGVGGEKASRMKRAAGRMGLLARHVGGKIADIGRAAPGVIGKGIIKGAELAGKAHGAYQAGKAASDSGSASAEAPVAAKSATKSSDKSAAKGEKSGFWKKAGSLAWRVAKGAGRLGLAAGIGLAKGAGGQLAKEFPSVGKVADKVKAVHQAYKTGKEGSTAPSEAPAPGAQRAERMPGRGDEGTPAQAASPKATPPRPRRGAGAYSRRRAVAAEHVESSDCILTEGEAFHETITEELLRSEDDIDRAICNEFYELSVQDIKDMAELYEDLGDNGMSYIDYAYDTGGTSFVEDFVESIYRPHMTRFMSEDVQSLVDAFAPMRSIARQTNRPVRKSSGSDVVDKIAARGQLAARLKAQGVQPDTRTGALEVPGKIGKMAKVAKRADLDPSAKKPGRMKRIAAKLAGIGGRVKAGLKDIGSRAADAVGHKYAHAKDRVGEVGRSVGGKAAALSKSVGSKASELGGRAKSAIGDTAHAARIGAGDIGDKARNKATELKYKAGDKASAAVGKGLSLARRIAGKAWDITKRVAGHEFGSTKKAAGKISKAVPSYSASKQSDSKAQSGNGRPAYKAPSKPDIGALKKKLGLVSHIESSDWLLGDLARQLGCNPDDIFLDNGEVAESYYRESYPELGRTPYGPAGDPKEGPNTTKSYMTPHYAGTDSPREDAVVQAVRYFTDPAERAQRRSAMRKEVESVMGRMSDAADEAGVPPEGMFLNKWRDMQRERIRYS